MTALDRLISIPRRNTDDDAWQARIDARRADNAHHERIRVAEFQAVAKIPTSARTPKPPRSNRNATRARPANPRVYLPTLRPCDNPACGHPTRSNHLKAADHPGTRPRARKGLCSTCAEKVGRPRTGTRTPRVTDAELATWVDLHLAGKSAYAIARDQGRQRVTVLDHLRRAGVYRGDL